MSHLKSTNAGRGDLKAARLPKAVESVVVLGADDYVRRIDLEGMPELMRVADVARLLALSRGSVYVLVNSGELSAVRLGPAMLRVFRNSVIDFIKRRIR